MKERVIISGKFMYYSVLVPLLIPVIVSSIFSLYSYETYNATGIVFSGLVWTVFTFLFFSTLRKLIYLEITENDALKFGNVFLEQEVSFSDVEYVEAASNKIIFTISINGKKYEFVSNQDLFELLRRRLYQK